MKEKMLTEKNTNQRLDITGQRFGRLVAIRPTKLYKRGKSNSYYWLFQCDCGQEKEILLASVTRKKDSTKSCGCLQRVRIEHLGSKEKVAFIRSGLRALSLKWPPRYHVKAAAKVAYGTYLCAGIDREPHEARSKDVQVDHIEPIGNIENWDSYIEKLFCPASNLQVLCQDCHKIKTKKEHENNSYKNVIVESEKEGFLP